jgi:hypothetical protein
VPSLQAHGLTVEPPRGWEGRIFRRPEHGEVSSAAAGAPGAPAPQGEETYAVVHVATIPLPVTVADYASDAVPDLGPNDALVIVKEFAPSEAGTPLFAPVGLPRSLDPDAFDPATLQRRLPGQAGVQRFFHESERAFCLYVVLGGYSNRHSVVPGVNAVLSSVLIDPLTSPRP